MKIWLNLNCVYIYILIGWVGFRGCVAGGRTRRVHIYTKVTLRIISSIIHGVCTRTFGQGVGAGVVDGKGAGGVRHILSKNNHNQILLPSQ